MNKARSTWHWNKIKPNLGQVQVKFKLVGEVQLKTGLIHTAFHLTIKQLI